MLGQCRTDCAADVWTPLRPVETRATKRPALCTRAALFHAALASSKISPHRSHHNHASSRDGRSSRRRSSRARRRMLDILVSLITVAEGTSIRLRRRRVVTRAWQTTERRQLALSSAELHQGATRANQLRAPAEVFGRIMWLRKPRGVPAGAQIFHRKGPRGRNGPSADGPRDRYGEQGDRCAPNVCRPNHRDPTG